MRFFAALLALCVLSACAGGPHKPATHKTAVQWPGTHSAAMQSAREQAAGQKEPVAYVPDAQVAGTPGADTRHATAHTAMAPGAAPSGPAPSATEGYLVASVDELVPVDVQVLPKVLNGLLPLTGSYQLKIRKVGGEPVGTFGCAHDAFDLHANDLDALRRFGYVTVRQLQPGRYEIYGYNVKWHQGKGKDKAMTSAEPFSIPFTITAGQTTYLGNYGAVGFKAKNEWGNSVPAGAYFVIADKAERDLQIAKGKMAQIGPATNQTPDPTTLGVAAFKPAILPAQ